MKNNSSESHIDAANRLENQIQTQISIINGIDDKAEHVTRLIAILIGLVFSVLSLVANFSRVNFDEPYFATELTFMIGIACLLLAMGAAIITYLSSKFRMGLHYSVGHYLKDERNVDFNTHISRVCGAYGDVIEANKRVIEANSKRFRFSLFFLLIGVVYLSIAGSVYLSNISEQGARVGLVFGVVLSLLAGYYILEGNYLTLEPIGDGND